MLIKKSTTGSTPTSSETLKDNGILSNNLNPFFKAQENWKQEKRILIFKFTFLLMLGHIIHYLLTTNLGHAHTQNPVEASLTPKHGFVFILLNAQSFVVDKFPTPVALALSNGQILSQNVYVHKRVETEQYMTDKNTDQFMLEVPLEILTNIMAADQEYKIFPKGIQRQIHSNKGQYHEIVF